LAFCIVVPKMARHGLKSPKASHPVQKKLKVRATPAHQGFAALREDRKHFKLTKRFIPPAKCRNVLKVLKRLPLERKSFTMFKKVIHTPRLIGLFFDGPGHYKYPKPTRADGSLTPTLRYLLRQVNAALKENFDCVVVNHYRNGSDYIGLHSDREVKSTSAASLSFGHTRSFRLVRCKDNRTVDFPLESGDLLLMKAGVQQLFKHALPKSKDDGERISVSFRKLDACGKSNP